jgi:hypothetical protein
MKILCESLSEKSGPTLKFGNNFRSTIHISCDQPFVFIHENKLKVQDWTIEVIRFDHFSSPIHIGLMITWKIMLMFLIRSFTIRLLRPFWSKENGSNLEHCCISVNCCRVDLTMVKVGNLKIFLLDWVWYILAIATSDIFLLDMFTIGHLLIDRYEKWVTVFDSQWVFHPKWVGMI